MTPSQYEHGPDVQTPNEARIAALTAEVERLKARLEGMDAVRLQGWRNAEHAGEQRDAAEAEADRLRAEVERLKAALVKAEMGEAISMASNASLTKEVNELHEALTVARESIIEARDVVETALGRAALEARP